MSSISTNIDNESDLSVYNFEFFSMNKTDEHPFLSKDIFRYIAVNYVLAPTFEQSNKKPGLIYLHEHYPIDTPDYALYCLNNLSYKNVDEDFTKCINNVMGNKNVNLQLEAFTDVEIVEKGSIIIFDLMIFYNGLKWDNVLKRIRNRLNSLENTVFLPKHVYVISCYYNFNQDLQVLTLPTTENFKTPVTFLGRIHIPAHLLYCFLTQEEEVKMDDLFENYLKMLKNNQTLNNENIILKRVNELLRHDKQVLQKEKEELTKSIKSIILI